MVNFKVHFIVTVTLAFLFTLIIPDAQAEVFAVYDFEAGSPQIDRDMHPNPWAFSIVTSPVRLGNHAGRFEVREGDYWRGTSFTGDVDNKRNRSEFSEDHYRLPQGQDQYYGYSIYLPEDFPDKDNWEIFTQWHGRPDQYLNEIWRSPILAMRYGNNGIYFTIRYSAEKVQYENDGTRLEIVRIENFQKGVWHDFVVHLRWSYRNDGQVEIWHNGARIKNYQGPVGYNDEDGVYWKFGIYRAEHPSTDVIFLDEYRRGDSFEAVSLVEEISQPPAQNDDGDVGDGDVDDSDGDDGGCFIRILSLER